MLILCNFIFIIPCLSKNLFTIEAKPLWYPSYSEFLATLNALSLKTLSEAVLLANYLKPP